jgi:hypothetical protein
MNKQTMSNHFYQAGRYASFLFALSLFFSKAVHNISFGIGMLCFFVVWGLKKESVEFGDKQLRTSILIMTIGLALFTSFSTIGLESTQKVITRYYKYLMFFPLVAFIHNKKYLGIFLVVCLCSLTISHILSADILYLQLHRKTKYFDLIGYANILSIACGALLSFVLFWQTNTKTRILLWVLLGLSFYSLVLIGTRGAYVAVIPVILFLCFVKSKKLCLLAVLLSVGLYSALPVSYHNLIKSIGNTNHADNKIRILMWKASVYTFTKNPVFGAGYGGNDKFFKEYYKSSGDWDYVKTRYPEQDNAHSTYFSWLSRFGLMFFFLLYLKFWLIPRKLFILYQRKKDSLDKALVFSIAAGFLSTYLSGLTENQTTKQVTGYFFVTLIALLSICLKISREKKHSSRPVI